MTINHHYKFTTFIIIHVNLCFPYIYYHNKLIKIETKYHCEGLCIDESVEQLYDPNYNQVTYKKIQLNISFKTNLNSYIYYCLTYSIIGFS